jgi:hypothetical protein
MVSWVLLSEFTRITAVAKGRTLSYEPIYVLPPASGALDALLTDLTDVIY